MKQKGKSSTKGWICGTLWIEKEKPVAKIRKKQSRCWNSNLEKKDFGGQLWSVSVSTWGVKEWKARKAFGFALKDVTSDFFDITFW